MSRPPLEVADILRAAGDDFIHRNQTHLAWPQLKVLRAIRYCRTQALGAIWTDALDVAMKPFCGLARNAANRACPSRGAVSAANNVKLVS